jgi:hypothetical protein
MDWLARHHSERARKSQRLELHDHDQAPAAFQVLNVGGKPPKNGRNKGYLAERVVMPQSRKIKSFRMAPQAKTPH